MAAEDRLSADELVIAVYLDTNVLLDLLATVEDGFSLVERVTSGQTRADASERSGSAEFGAPGVLNFFKLGFSGRLGKSTNMGTSDTTEADITHTYGSLLHRLRRYLLDEGLVRTPGSGVEAGTFVEFTGVVRPNPFTSSFRQLQRMLSFVTVAAEMAVKATPPQPSAKPGRGGQPPRRANPELAQAKAISDFIEQLTSDVEREGTSTVLVESQSSEYRAVVTLYEDFLRDRSMAELLNREFRVLGKTARVLPEGSPESVDLIALSGIAGLPPELLGQLTGVMREISASGAAQLADPVTEIKPPVVEIVPIAIYL
jgi:hypothetical protein